jgi:hypothetical protein
LAVLGLKLLVIEDPEAVATYGSRIPPRKENFVHGATMEFRISRRAFRQIQAKGRRARWDKMTAEQRSEWARELNRIRWIKAKQVSQLSRAPKKCGAKAKRS